MALELAGIKLVAEGADAFIGDVTRGQKAVGDFVGSAETGGTRMNAASEVMIGGLRRIGEAAVNALAQATQAVGAFIGESITQAGNFEAGTNRLAAVAGSSLSAAGFSLEDVSAKALKMGADTQFSAGQAQDAMLELAKGGVPISQVMGDATDATLALAAAGEVELGPAAEIVAKQLGVWSETGVTAAQVSDQIAQAANASTVDVQDLALGLAQAGGQAKVSGVEFGDLVQTMALIAPNFASASDAGTSLKTMLARLVPSTDPAYAAMSELGLISLDLAKAQRVLGIDLNGVADPAKRVEDVISQMAAAQTKAQAGTAAYTTEYNGLIADITNSVSSNVFFDAQGGFLGMQNAAAQLQTATAGLSEEQKSQALNTIFGTDALRAAAAIATAGAPGFDAMGAAMAGAGTASEQAAIRNQGFNFALETMKGSVETLQIVLGTVLLPILADFLNNYITPGINAVMQWAQQIDAAGGPMNALSNAITPFLPLLAGLAVGLGAYAVSLGAYAVSQGIATVSAWAGTAAFGTMAATVVLAAAPFVALGAAVALLYAAWQNDFGGMRTFLTDWWTGTALPILTVLRDWLATTITAAITTLSGFWTNTLKPALNAVWTFIQQSVIPVLTDLGGRVFGALQSAITTLAGFWTTTLQPALIAVWTYINDNVVPLLAALGDVTIAALGVALTALTGIWQNVLQPALRAAWTFIKDNLSPVFDSLSATVIPAVKTAFEALSGWWTATGKPIFDGIATFFSNVLSGAIDSVTTAIQGAITWLQDLAGKLNTLELPAWMTPGSPTPWEIGLRGVNNELSLLNRRSLVDLTGNLMRMDQVSMIARPQPVTTITNNTGDRIAVDARGNTPATNITAAVNAALAQRGRRADVSVRMG